MAQINGDNTTSTIDRILLERRTAPKRRITGESIAWGLGMMLMAYMIFVAVAGILYRG